VPSRYSFDVNQQSFQPDIESHQRGQFDAARVDRGFQNLRTCQGSQPQLGIISCTALTFTITASSAELNFLHHLRQSPPHCSLPESTMARTSAKAQTLTGTQKPPKPRSSRKRPEKVPLASPVLDIPYFADMQLNPARYPLGELYKSPCYDHTV
jgi:hypothetical protein